MSDTAAVDQQIVIHLFAPAEGPRADVAYAALRELWLGCRQFFLMREPIPGIGLPSQLPAAHGELPGAAATGEEAALAAQERSGADCQAILRRHHDVLNLSVVLARPVASAAPASGHTWWQDLDSQWNFLSARLTGNLLGEARIYLARGGTPPGRPLDDLLPAPARTGAGDHSSVLVDGRLTLWEAPPWTDDRPLRRFVIAFDDDDHADRLASAWVWSRGDTAIPPLARYLLYAAKLRHMYRVWRHDARTRESAADVMAGAGDPGEKAREARLASAGLRELQRSVEIALHNMGLVVSSPELLVPNGPFADDRELARSFLAQLDDEIFYLGIAAERAAEMTALPAREERQAAASPAPPAAAQGLGGADAARSADITRNVFVIHGRDDQARDALFGFLRALGLNPLGWETLVAATGNTSPYLREVIVQGIGMAQAAVVLMTPDDVVWLHPALHGADEDDHEASPAMQARPNVILELGMALATYADRTIVLMAGKHRPMADLGGLNYIRLTDSDECLEKIMRRLQTAQCRVRDEAPDWRARAWFSHLAAYHRKPPEQ